MPLGTMQDVLRVSELICDIYGSFIWIYSIRITEGILGETRSDAPLERNWERQREIEIIWWDWSIAIKEKQIEKLYTR